MSYVVRIGYNAEAKRYFVLSSDIVGLNVEANSVDEFVEVVRDLALDLVGEHAAGSSIDFRVEREFA